MGITSYKQSKNRRTTKLIPKKYIQQETPSSKKLSWDDYFTSFLPPKPEPKIVNKEDYSNSQATLLKLQTTKMLTKSSSYLPQNKFNGDLISGSERPSGRLVQKKMKAECAPVNFYKNQGWEELIARTIDANTISTTRPRHQAKNRESLSRTKRTIDPEKQEERDVFNNKITGCAKKKYVEQQNIQVFKIQQPIKYTPARKQKDEIILKTFGAASNFRRTNSVDTIPAGPTSGSGAR